MFTGIIQAVGTIASIETLGADRRVVIDAGTLDLSDVAGGDSICVNGACLTALEVLRVRFSADVSAETLTRTTFSELGVSDQINLEKALTPTTRLGGHLVSGHVDGTGTVVARWSAGRSVVFRIGAPASLAKYIAQKGSICVDGISLTVNTVRGSEFEVNIVPHTLEQTTMSEFQQGRQVNLEVDIIARYLERLLQGEEQEADSKLTVAFLAEHGFLR
ncbi:MAG: riboflavin synthase [Acidiferrobacterales bacterium]